MTPELVDQFVEAIKGHDAARARQMLDAHPDLVNAAQPVEDGDPGVGLPMLFWACVSNNVPMARLLLERGAAQNDGESSYHAAQFNHRECLELLLAYGEDISSRHSHWNNTPLYFLAGHMQDLDGTAPWLKGLEWLLDHGADPNVWSYAKKETPLHAIAARPSPTAAAAAELLIAHGADVNRPRADGTRPFAIAVRNGNTAIADLLRAHGATEGVSPMDALLGACMRGDAEAARALSIKHPDLVKNLMAVDESGTPLHRAAWMGRADAVRVLVDLGAPVNLRDSEFGSSPIGWAAHGSSNCRSADEDYCAVVELLVAAGATVDASINKWNVGPQALASPRVADLLKQRGWPPSPQ